jgi:hypothetical protein
VSTTTTDHVQELQARVEELEARLEHTQVSAEMDMASLGAQLATMKRENDALKGKLADRAKEITKRDHELYVLWLEVHGKDRNLKVNAFGPAAQRALTRARKVLDQADMEKVIRVHARYPFLKFGEWDASKGQRKDGISDAFKDENRWNALLRLADKPAPRPSHVPNRHEDHFNTRGQSTPIENLYQALEDNDCNAWLPSSGQGSAHCPIHDDRERSFRFKEGTDGGVLMYCFACSPGFVSNKAFCETVRQDLQITITDLYPNRRS